MDPNTVAKPILEINKDHLVLSELSPFYKIGVLNLTKLRTVGEYVLDVKNVIFPTQKQFKRIIMRYDDKTLQLIFDETNIEFIGDGQCVIEIDENNYSKITCQPDTYYNMHNMVDRTIIIYITVNMYADLHIRAMYGNYNNKCKAALDTNACTNNAPNNVTLTDPKNIIENSTNQKDTDSAEVHNSTCTTNNSGSTGEPYSMLSIFGLLGMSVVFIANLYTIFS